MRTIILYSTLGCHLCELAKEQLEPLIGQYELHLEEMDIANDEGLMEKYGVKIPVLQLQFSQNELFWPFDTAGIDNFLRQNFNKPS
jgi:hypothetical protein